MKRKFYWVDADVKLLFLGITFFISALAVVFILNYKQIPWYATAFLVFVSLFLWWVTFNSFKQGIVVDKASDKLILYNIRKKVFNIKDISDIWVDTAYSIDPAKYCVTLIVFKDGTNHRFPGYVCMNSKKSVQLTLESVNWVKKYMFQKST